MRGARRPQNRSRARRADEVLETVASAFLACNPLRIWFSALGAAQLRDYLRRFYRRCVTRRFESFPCGHFVGHACRRPCRRCRRHRRSRHVHVRGYFGTWTRYERTALESRAKARGTRTFHDVRARRFGTGKQSPQRCGSSGWLRCRARRGSSVCLHPPEGQLATVAHRGVILGAVTLVMSEGSATALGATNWSTWSTWSASDWISDIVPRTLYGLTTAWVVENFRQ